MGPAPIRRGIYCWSWTDDGPSAGRLSDAARVFFVVLYRLQLITEYTALDFTVTREQLRKFGIRWYRPGLDSSGIKIK
jgi:hypothetical protein